MAIRPMSSFVTGSSTAKSNTNKVTPFYKFISRIKQGISYLDYLDAAVEKKQPHSKAQFASCHDNAIKKTMVAFGISKERSVKSSLLPYAFFDDASMDVYVAFRLKYIKIGSVYVSASDPHIITKDNGEACCGGIQDAIAFYQNMLQQMNRKTSVSYKWFEELRTGSTPFVSQIGTSPVTVGNPLIALPPPDILDAEFEEE